VRLRCSHNPSFVEDVPVEQVIGLALPLLQAERQA
jgi:hypothetical protein